MKYNIYIYILGLTVLFSSCSKKFDLDAVVNERVKECGGYSNCIIDMSTVTNFDWDTMYFFSGANSLEEINKGIGFKFKEFVDNGDRIIFLNNGEVVFHKDWYNDPERPFSGVVIGSNLKSFKISNRNAKFTIRKDGEIVLLVPELKN